MSFHCIQLREMFFQNGFDVIACYFISVIDFFFNNGSWPFSPIYPRTFVYSLLTRGRPFPVVFLFRGFVFCMGNGLLQGYYLVYCAEYPAEWYTDIRFSLGKWIWLLLTHTPVNTPSHRLNHHYLSLSYCNNLPRIPFPPPPPHDCLHPSLFSV